MHLLKSLAISALLLPAVSFAADVPKENCSNIKWNAQFLREYPKAAVACREVVVKDGLKYATFKGKVSKVDAQVVEVEISNVADTPISTIGFEVGVGGRVTRDGKLEKVKDLKVGDLLTFWVREDQFGISPTLTEKPLRIVKPKPMTE